MKVYAYTFSLVLLILGLSATPLRAQDQGQASSVGYPTLDRAVEITDMQLLGNATKGATVTLQVRFRAHVDGPGSIMLRYPKHVAPPGRRPEETFRTKPLQLTNGEEYVKTYPMRVEDTGGAMVSVIIQADGVSEGYDPSDSEHINVVSGTDTYQVFAPGDTTRRRVTATKGTAEKAQAKTQSFYTVSVSGKIDFFDNQGRTEGLYGSEVELWFRDSSTPDQLYHPVLGDSEHTHYDEVSEDGQYHFDFSFDGDLSGYDELLVLVATSNDAATTSVGQGAWIIDSGNGSETFFGSQQGVAYDISGVGTTISFSNADAEVNSEDGALLRNMTLAREFIEQRYGGNLPFSLPTIAVHKEELSDAAGIFTCSWDIWGNESYHIEIDPDWTDVSTVTHEYGHWIHYRMWDGGDCSTYDDATEQVAEGWAISYSFGARNYANEAYGDALRDSDDNTEVAPFRVDPLSGNRFDTIRYAEGGNPAYAAFGCYLWNLYDNYSGGPFEVALYDDGDNDDVSGYANDVFEVFRTDQETNASDYNVAFKSGLSSETQASVQSIYDFMTADFTSVPSIPMRPPQLTNASGQIKTNGDVDFQWAEQSYPTGRDYGNYPDGYRLDKDGQNVATASFGTTSYTYAPSGTNSGNYQLTAYNVDGDAQSAPTLDLGIDVTISGPSSVSSGEQGTWTANVSGGTGTLSYQWYEKFDTDPSFSLISGATSASYSSVYFNNVLLKAEVTADNGSDTHTKYVTVGSEGTNQIVLADRLAHFGGKATGDGTAILTWETSRSTLMDTPFAVQRTLGSTGETAWTTIGTVEARSSDATYRFMDRTLPFAADTLHYRLWLVGSDGAASASDPIAVVRENVSAVQLKETYPNPAAEQVTVRYAVPEDATGDVRLTLYDAMGRAVRTIQAGPVQGRRRVQLDVGGLSSGVYLLRLRAGGTVTSRRLTVVR